MRDAPEYLVQRTPTRIIRMTGDRLGQLYKRRRNASNFVLSYREQTQHSGIGTVFSARTCRRHTIVFKLRLDRGVTAPHHLLRGHSLHKKLTRAQTPRLECWFDQRNMLGAKRNNFIKQR